VPDRPPRVAVVCATRRIAALAPGGAGVHLRGIARGFVEAGAEVELWVGRGSPGADQPAAPPPDGVRLRVARRGRMPGVLRRRGRAWDEGVDAAAMARQAAGWARRFRPDLVYERSTLFGAVGRRCGGFWALEVNAPVAWEAVWFEGEAPRPALLRREGETLRAADRLFVVHEALAEHAVRRGAPRDRIELLPNGVAALPSIAARPESGPDAPFVLGYEGTFKPWQGLVDELPRLRVLAEELAPRPLVVELWGDGPARAALLAAGGGLDLRVRGWGTPDRRSWHAAWIPLAPWPPPGAAFDEPPPDRYFCPLKEAEARAAGLPLFRAGRLDPPGSVPGTWGSIAATVLQSTLGGVVGSAGSSWDDRRLR
jgi:hypothetical protein